MTTKKIIICIDHEDDLINARLIDFETLEMIAQSEMGPWRNEQDAIYSALHHANNKGVFREDKT